MPSKLRRFIWSLGFFAACFAQSNRISAAQRVESPDGVIVSGGKESTEAGLKILRAGGTAADAAVAVSLALGVSEPFNSGLGGKFVALYYEARTGKVYSIEALDLSPSDFPVAEFAARTPDERETGYASACIPGCVAGLDVLHKRWGRLPWKECFQPAIRLAENGYPVPAKQLVVFKDELDVVCNDPEAMRIYFPGGKVPEPDTMLTNKDLAHTLELIAENGAQEFYRGEIAKKIVAASQAGGGWLTERDFASYRAHELPPLSGDYKNYQVFTSPPPLTGGAILLLALKALEYHDWNNTAPTDVARIDETARVFQQIYPITSSSFADIPEAPGNVRKIFTPSVYASIAKAAENSDPQSPFSTSDRKAAISEDGSGSTTHFIVVDRDGNIVTATQSLSHHFGAGVVTPGTGILLNDCMSNFGYGNRSSINYAGPDKRPRSTITPVIVLEKGKPVLALGSPAAQRIPTGVYQVLSGVLDFGLKLPEAVDEPRFHTRSRRTSKEPPNVIDLEEGFDDATGQALREKGWEVYSKRRDNYYFGGVNAVRFLPGGVREAVADDRRTNWAQGE